MRSTPLYLTFAFLLSASADEVESNPAEPTTGTGTQVLSSLEVEAFTPPPPQTTPSIPEMRIEESCSACFPEHKITVLRGEPSSLPEIARTSAQALATPNSAPGTRSSAEGHPILLRCGATVYDHKVSLVNWQHPDDPGKSFQALVGLDFGVFSLVRDFSHLGVSHSLMFVHSDISTQEVQPLTGRPGIALPAVPDGEFVITSGDAQDVAGIAPFMKLIDLLAAQGNELQQAYSARLKYLQDEAEWKKQQPAAKPADRTFWLRPHRGSRYLQSNGEGAAR